MDKGHDNFADFDVNFFAKKSWFGSCLNDCKVNRRLTQINSRHIGFLRSGEAYVISSNIEGGWRFNFDVPCLRDSNNKKILNFTLNCIWNLKVGSIFDWFNIQRYFW